MKKEIISMILFVSMSIDLQAYSQDVSDPLINQLFVMPTSEILSRGQGMVGTTEMVILNGCYAPTIFLQIGVSATNPFMLLFHDTHNSFAGSLGAKLQLAKTDGFFRGISLGTNLLWMPAEPYYSQRPDDLSNYESPYHGNFYDDLFNIHPPHTSPLSVLVNATTSVGTNNIQVHASYGQLYFQREDRGIPVEGRNISSIVQLGFSAGGSVSEKVGLKFMAEFYTTGPIEGLTIHGTLAGLRLYMTSFTIDIGFPLVLEKRVEVPDPPVPLIAMNAFF